MTNNQVFDFYQWMNQNKGILADFTAKELADRASIELRFTVTDACVSARRRELGISRSLMTVEKDDVAEKLSIVVDVLYRVAEVVGGLAQMYGMSQQERQIIEAIEALNRVNGVEPATVVEVKAVPSNG